MKKLILAGLFGFVCAVASAQDAPTQPTGDGGDKVNPKETKDSKDTKDTKKEGATDSKNVGPKPSKFAPKVEETGNPKTDRSTKVDKASKDDGGDDPKKSSKKDDGDEDNTAKKKKRGKDDEDIASDAILYKTRTALPPARIYGQQFFRDRSISVFTSERKVETLDNYLLDLKDELSVTIWGDAAYSGVFEVNEQGYVDFSTEFINIPRIYVKGMTFGHCKQVIKNHIGQYIDLKGPRTQIEIIINRARNISVNITGEVFSPGAYSIPATNTAFNAMVAAGGPSQIGSVREIKVISGNKQPRTLDLYQYILDPSPKEEFFLSNNDYIFIPLAGRVVHIDGAVKRPFYYELVKGEQLLKLIDFAGGMQPDAFKTNVQVKRFINDEEILIDISLAKLIKEGKDFELLDGDDVAINPIQQSYSNYVNVEGAVKIPGEYELEIGKTRLSDLIEKAGLLASARMDRIYIIRVKEDLSKEYIRINLENLMKDKSAKENLTLRPFDKIRIDPKSRFRNDYSINVFGSVREPGAQIYSPNLTLKDVIFLCGGLKEEAANNRIEISRVIKNNNESTRIVINTVTIDDDLSIQNDFLLEPFDEVFVRTAAEFELQRNVIISGEVRYPGQYTLIDKRERVLSLIQRAGGPTYAAFLEGAYMVRKEDNQGRILLNAQKVLEDPNSNYNYILHKGDSIFIPKMKDLVTIKGAVNYPPIDSGYIDKIAVPFHEGKNALFYVQNYGAGVSRYKNGKKNLIYVTYPSGQIRKTKVFLGIFRKYPKVEKGSIVSVETKKRKKKEASASKGSNFDWQKFWATTMAQVSAALTLYLLMKTAFSR